MKKNGLGIVMSCILVIMLTACSSAVSNGSEATVGTGTTETATGTNAGDTGTGANGEKSPSGDKTKIVFSAFHPTPGFQEAKEKYEALHPNIEIKLQSAYTDDAHLEADLEKFVTTTNTAMLAGKGPDLLLMDELNTDNYVKHKLLADLGTMMDQDSTFRKEDYFENILDNVRIAKELYSVPLSFFLVGLAGDENAIAKTGVKVDDTTWSWSDFTKTAEKLVAAKGKYSSALASYGPEFLLADMVADNYSLYVDEASHKAHFDSAEFTGLLNKVKSMCVAGIVNAQGIAMVPGVASGDNHSSCPGGSGAYFEDVKITSPSDYLTSLREHGENVKLYIKPHAQDTTEGGYFQTFRNVSINTRSKVKQEAWDFLKFMMSDTAAGFPINKKGFSDNIQKLKNEGTVQTYEGGPLHGMTIKVDAVKLDQLESFVSGAVHPVALDSGKIPGLILNESKAFFAGQKSADEVAKLIQNKAMTYLNE